MHHFLIKRKVCICISVQLIMINRERTYSVFFWVSKLIRQEFAFESSPLEDDDIGRQKMEPFTIS